MDDVLFRLTIRAGDPAGVQEWVEEYPGEGERFEQLATDAIDAAHGRGLTVVRLEVDDARGKSGALDRLRKQNPGLETGIARGPVNGYTDRKGLPTPSRSRRSGYHRAL